MKILMITFLILVSGNIAKAAGLDFVYGYSFAEEFDSDNGDIESENAFILGARFKEIMKKGLGWDAGITLDSIRDFDNRSGELGFFLLQGNVSLAVDQIKALYIFIGLNYPVIYDDKDAGDVDPALGMQFGTGLHLTDQVGVELGYRAINFEFGSAEADLWGFALTGYYTFAGL